jgi:hypothetical protein
MTTVGINACLTSRPCLLTEIAHYAHKRVTADACEPSIQICLDLRQESVQVVVWHTRTASRIIWVVLFSE